MSNNEPFDDKDILELLKPRCEVKASDDLRKRTVKTLHSAIKTKRFRLVFTGLASAAAVAAIFILFVVHTPNLSAQELINDALAQFGIGYSIEFEARTTSTESFAYFDETLSPITVKLDVSGSNWRIEKGDRKACGNDSTKRMWISSLDFGWKSSAGDSNFIEEFRYLLDPEKLLSDYLSSPAENTDIKIADDKIILTITDATDDVRIYTFDKANHRLLGYRIERNGNEIIRSTAINYGPVNIDSHIPENIKFVDVNNIKGAYANLSAEEVATITLAAFKAWDTNVIEKICVLYPMDLIKAQLEGSEIVRIGTTTEGRYKTVVPYCLRLRDGSVHYGNLSLMKIEGSGWIIDGGI